MSQKYNNPKISFHVHINITICSGVQKFADWLEHNLVEMQLQLHGDKPYVQNLLGSDHRAFENGSIFNNYIYVLRVILL